MSSSYHSVISVISFILITVVVYTKADLICVAGRKKVQVAKVGYVCAYKVEDPCDISLDEGTYSIEKVKFSKDYCTYKPSVACYCATAYCNRHYKELSRTWSNTVQLNENNKDLFECMLNHLSFLSIQSGMDQDQESKRPKEVTSPHPRRNHSLPRAVTQYPKKLLGTPGQAWEKVTTEKSLPPSEPVGTFSTTELTSPATSSLSWRNPSLTHAVSPITDPLPVPPGEEVTTEKSSSQSKPIGTTSTTELSSTDSTTKISVASQGATVVQYSVTRTSLRSEASSTQETGQAESSWHFNERHASTANDRSSEGTWEASWFWLVFTILAVIAGILLFVVIPPLAVLAVQAHQSLSNAKH